MKLTHGFKGLEITISWSFDILFRHNSWNYFPPAILHMLSRLITLVSVSGQSRYALTLHLRNSQTPLSVKCQFIGEIQNNQNFRKFRSKTQWIGSVQPEKFRKTGPPFEVNHFFPVRPVGILVEWIAPIWRTPPSPPPINLKPPLLSHPTQLISINLDIQSTTFVSISSWNRSNSDAVREQGHPKSIFGKYLFGRRLEI